MTPEPTAAQWPALDAYVIAHPVLSLLPHYPKDDPDPAHHKANGVTAGDIAQHLNNKETGFYIWKDYLSLETIYANGMDWTLVDNLAVGRARIWEWLFRSSGMGGGSINPSKANVRAGIAECWKGTDPMLAQRAVILGHCKTTDLLIGERVFSVGTGTLASPAVRTCCGILWGGNIYNEHYNTITSWGW